MTPAKRPRSARKRPLHKVIPGLINCVQFEEFMVNYFEGTLPPVRRMSFNAHLKMCRECRDYLAAYKQTIDLGKAVFKDPDGPLPDDVPEDLVQAILAARNSPG